MTAAVIEVVKAVLRIERAFSIGFGNGFALAVTAGMAISRCFGN
jgi:hypothetical protein